MHKNLINYLQNFRQIPNADQMIISEAFTPRHYKAGDWLLKAGQPANQLFFINEGILKITVPHPQEKDMVYFFLKNNQLMTFLYSMYSRVPAQQGLQAASNTDVLEINYTALFHLYETMPYLRHLIDQIAQLSMAEMVTVKNAYLTGSASEKYKMFIQNQPEIAKYVSLADVASYLTITPQSLSRIRKTLVKK